MYNTNREIKMKVAILGAGFGGLAAGYFIKHYSIGQTRVDFFDPNPLGTGASRIALGMVNPYMGREAKRSHATTRSLRELHRLLTVSAKEMNQPLVISQGILRPATSDKTIEAFKARANEYEELDWLDKQEALKHIPELNLPDNGGALYIKDGITVDIAAYMEGLWLASARYAAQFTKLTVLKKDQLASYDRVLIALGANSLDFDVLKALPMTRVKGQVLQLEWPKNLSPLKMNLSGEGQVVMAPDYESCFVGSTYEHDFKDVKAHPAQAQKEIMKKINRFYPALKNAKVLSCRARVRASSKTNLPLIGQLNEKVWFLTGLGSKGFFYHGWTGKMVAQAMIMNNTDYIHPDFLCRLPDINAPQPQS